MRRKGVCGDCPLLKKGFCAHYAQTMVPEHPACDFGRRAIGNLRRVQAMRRRRNEKAED